jgi:hypothetical protein
MCLIWNYSGFKPLTQINLATKLLFQVAILMFGIYSLHRLHGDTVSGTVIETKEFNKTNLVNAYNFVAEVSAQEYFIETTDQQGGKITQIGSFTEQECVAVNYSNPSLLNGSNLYSATITTDNFPLGVHDSAQVVWMVLRMSGKWFAKSAPDRVYPLVLTTHLMEQKFPFAEARIINVSTEPGGLLRRFTVNLPPVLYFEEMELKSLGINTDHIAKLARTSDNRFRVNLSKIQNDYPFINYESEWNNGEKYPFAAKLTRLYQPDESAGSKEAIANWAIKVTANQASGKTVPSVAPPHLVTVQDYRFIDLTGKPKPYLLHREPWPSLNSPHYLQLRGQARAEGGMTSRISARWALAIICGLAVMPIMILGYKKYFRN